ncbi:MAG: hypothetical protein RLZZ505_2455 [Verrucomicrobiota bacterium]
MTFTWIALPSKAETLPAGIFGLPEGVISSGGTAQWELLVAPDDSANGLKTTLTPERNIAWLDLAVTGPCQVVCGIAKIDWGADVEFLVDGISRAVEKYNQEFEIKLEVPAGKHVVRVAAIPSPDNQITSPTEVWISKLKISRVPVQSRLISALDSDLPWLNRGLWKVSTAIPDAFNNSSIRPSESPSEVRTGFTGPGYLDFRYMLGAAKADTGQDGTLRLDSDTDNSLFSYLYFEEQGWKEGRHWFPPGVQRVSFSMYGDKFSLVQSGLDKIRFTPSPIVSVTDALDASGVVWENDPVLPWVGTLRSPPADDLVVSPAVALDQSTTLATTLTGPGEFSFDWSYLHGSGDVELWVAGRQIHYPIYNSDTRVTIPLLDSTPTRIEWIVRDNQGSSSPSSRLLLDHVVWNPHPLTALAEALDTSEAVAWSTHAQLPFTGRPHPDAKNGTAAYIALKPGEESWLEATVNGPGRFDFWLRDAAGVTLPGYLWNYWSLSIDGVPVEISGHEWPQQWITGDGPHRIRLTFRHHTESGVEWITGAVDDVTWIPITQKSLAAASGLKSHLWHTGSRSPARGFSSSGRADDSAVVLNPLRGETSWAQTYVLGPCELSWDSALNRYIGDSTAQLIVNGARVTDFENHAWQRMRLSLPIGIHTVRWALKRNPATENDIPQQATKFSQVWQIGGMRLEKGLSPLALATDRASLYALETGDAGGRCVKQGAEDFWEPGLHTSLYFFHPSQTGKLTAKYQSAGADGQGWLQRDETQPDSFLASSGSNWLWHKSVLHPGGFSKWTFDPRGIPAAEVVYPRLDSLGFRTGLGVGLAEAIESPRQVISDSWIGRAHRNAPVGEDFAWSLLNRANSAASGKVILTGPAKVSYLWKIHGEGSLTLYLDGAQLPVPPPTDEWTKVEFSIATGKHTLEWSHVLGFPPPAAASTLYASEACLDGLTLLSTPPVNLTAAGTWNGNPVLTSNTISPDFLPWLPAAYREANGSWTEAVRVVSGGRKLQTIVRGPAVIEFRARCFQRYLANSSQRVSSSSVVVIGPGWDTVTKGHLLAVAVDNIDQIRVENSSGAWTSYALHVPAGIHQVTFRLMAVRSGSFSTFLEDATQPEIQAWVDDLQIQSSAKHYAQWATNQSLAITQSGKADDTDKDGISNFMEYAFGSDPRDSSSRPPDLAVVMHGPRFLTTYPSTNPQQTFISANNFYLFLKIPYLPAHVSGVIESSEDMVNWSIEPTVILRYPPYPNSLLFTGTPVNTSSHHFQRIDESLPNRFYRIAISD